MPCSAFMLPYIDPLSSSARFCQSASNIFGGNVRKFSSNIGRPCTKAVCGKVRQVYGIIMKLTLKIWSNAVPRDLEKKK